MQLETPAPTRGIEKSGLTIRVLAEVKKARPLTLTLSEVEEPP